jgi:hypothetical protein
MANTFYPKAKKAWAKGQVNWEGDTIKVQLVDTAAYTYSAAHEFLSELPIGARVGAAITLANKTAADGGVLDADDGSFVALAGPQLEAIVIYQYTGVESTSRLLLYLDFGVGIPYTPNSSTVPLIWDNGSSKIARL